MVIKNGSCCTLLILLAQSFEDGKQATRNMALLARFTEAQCVFPKTILSTRRSLNTGDYKILNRENFLRDGAAKMC